MKNDDKVKKLEELKNQVAQFENLYKRAVADYENLEKRVAQERKTLILNSNKQLILRLLPVLDTLISANTHLKDQGITLCIQQFLGILKQEGVKEIPPTVGSKFDPHLMECIDIAEGEDGRVLEEIRTGYWFNDMILRPVQVKVGKKKTEE